MSQNLNEVGQLQVRGCSRAETTQVRGHAPPYGFRRKPSSSTSFVLLAAIATLSDGIVLGSLRNRMNFRGAPGFVAGSHVFRQYLRRGGLLAGEFRQGRRQIRRLQNGNDGWLQAAWLRATRFRSEEHRLETAAPVAETRNPRHPWLPLTLTIVL